jgi:predicted lipoprotein
MGLVRIVKGHFGVTLSIGGGLLLLLFLFASGTTVVSNEGKNESKGISASNTDFNAEEFVENTWSSKVIPNFEKKQNDITEIIEKLKEGNLETIGEENGKNDGANWNFVVSGKGKVLSVDTKSRKGKAEIDIDPYDGKADFTLLVGPVFEGYAIREVLDFIKFDDFSNQIEWSQLGSQYNTRTYQENLEGLILKEGQELDLSGVLTVKENSKLLTPVIIKRGED